MEISAHIDALRREGDLLAEAAARTDLSAPVPTCPDWRLGDLLRHIGHVHRWAAAFPSQGLRTPLDEAGERAAIGPMPSDAALLDWYREGHAALVDVLDAAPADVECWSFLPAPSPLAFWARRQAHETAVHRFDADAAAGSPGPAVDTALALDGIDELLRGFMVRSRSKLRSDRLRTVQVRTTDGPGSWRLAITGDPVAVTTDERAEPADLTLTGPARELYLLLWNRLTTAQDGRTERTEQTRQVEVTGDRDLLGLWRDTAVVG
ncbi:maleylpyruvate isomerase family mycothiol-dependent enzyme [Kitasatospora sp. SUK 42]|uniref:maleylpyruvate isomerase family mycothiol-dependent enzyme n=1 Tax=Kitasatospora sp. SUK 42 TaxID=1588882 RepID=UPI0018C9E2BB|nr:maleylpyruvate isomerase family mycothiol-dependent enzyme [Kitasatospora sp. SUK 42]MBV2156034.1 maleylpyruvate isomerase N-terminal domain-containing protein [Kitasatospora sp. SUK 42]